MPKALGYNEELVWWLTRQQIGQGLRERYQVPKELPSKLLRPAMKVDAIEERQLLRHSGTPSEREQMVEARTIGGVKAFPDWYVLT